MNNEESLRSLSFDYLNLLINGQTFSDVSFTVEGRIVHAHRCILAARSPFFRKFFAAGYESYSAAQVAVPLNSVSYEVFMLMLQFLYSGQVCIVPQKHEPRPDCNVRGCWHTHCSSAVDLGIQTLVAARSFGVEQLALLTQKQLVIMVEKSSIEDVMKVLIASKKHEMQQLLSICSQLVARSGLPLDMLVRNLPVELVARIVELRIQASVSCQQLLGSHSTEEMDQKIRRMRCALNSCDMELVKLMVMGEGLNLNEALALHYAVENCSREVVKALLELGAADVNYPSGPTGKTPLHLAAEMVSPEMVSVLLDHHADPNSRTVDGVTPMDVLRTLTSDFLFKGAIPGLAHIQPYKLKLCHELIKSAVDVIAREEGNAAGVLTEEHGGAFSTGGEVEGGANATVMGAGKVSECGQSSSRRRQRHINRRGSSS